MTKLRLRGHHLYCLRFTDMEFHERGGHFQDTYTRIRTALKHEPDALMQVILGPDDLCQACPLMANNACQSQRGGEPGVRKLDSIILSGLGIEPFSEMPVREYQAIIDRKSPISFCCRCKVGMNCEMRTLALARNVG